MDITKQEHYKQKLGEELVRVEGELRDLGWQNEQGEWEATGGDIDETATESDEIADRIEDFEERGGEVGALKALYKNINLAVEKLETGEFGVCEIGGEDIEEDRLDANPSARTCIMHVEQEHELE